MTYPGGKTLSLEDSNKAPLKGNLCSTCHSGREGKATVDANIATGKYAFKNIHYAAAASIKNGADAQVGYEYPGKTYAKAWKHNAGDDCTYCHDPKLSKHTFQVSDSLSKCTACHSGVTKPSDIRMPSHNKDYDGDGNSTEPLSEEIHTLSDALLAQILVEAAKGTKICYLGNYPYWAVDDDGDGKCGPTEKSGYKSWTPALLKAAFNYQASLKDHGAWAHNFDYMVQLLIDSIDDLGGSVTKYIRP